FECSSPPFFVARRLSYSQSGLPANTQPDPPFLLRYQIAVIWATGFGQKTPGFADYRASDGPHRASFARLRSRRRAVAQPQPDFVGAARMRLALFVLLAHVIQAGRDFGRWWPN